MLLSFLLYSNQMLRFKQTAALALQGRLAGGEKIDFPTNIPHKTFQLNSI